jgi:hypothetical protein
VTTLSRAACTAAFAVAAVTCIVPTAAAVVAAVTPCGTRTVAHNQEVSKDLERVHMIHAASWDSAAFWFVDLFRSKAGLLLV